MWFRQENESKISNTFMVVRPYNLYFSTINTDKMGGSTWFFCSATGTYFLGLFSHLELSAFYNVFSAAPAVC